MTALKFQGSLTLGVGTATGQVLLYDIRSSRPFLVKDHMYGLPILDVDFNDAQDLVLSMDSSVIKIWRKETVCKFVEFCECKLTTEFLVFVIGHMCVFHKWIPVAGPLTLILRRPKLYTKSLTRDLKRMYSRFTLVRISINL